MRAGPALLFVATVLAVAGLGGCGGDEARSGARLRVLTGVLDGVPEGNVKILALAGEDRGRIYDARVVDEDEPDVFQAPGAPPGRYRVFTDTGWGMLWVGSLGAPSPELLGPGEVVAPVRLGRPYSLYLAPTNPSVWQLGEAWFADCQRHDDPGAGYRRIPFESALDPEGIVALRFRPEDWVAGNELRVVGRMTSGKLSTVVSFAVPAEPYAKLPRLALVQGAAHAPLDLYLLGSGGTASAPDGTEATIELLGVPFTDRYLSESYKGRISFQDVATISQTLRVRLPGSGPRAVFDLDMQEWRMRGALYLVPVPPQEAVTGITIPEGVSRIVAIRAHFPGGAAFGRLPIERTLAGPGGGARTHVQAPPGPQEWLVQYADGTWSHAVLDVQPGVDVAAALSPPQEGCRVSGTVHGGTKDHRIEARLLLPAARDAAGAEAFPERRVGGFRASLSLTGQYEFRVPPGTVELTVVSPTGREGSPKERTLAPASRLRLDLSLR